MEQNERVARGHSLSVNALFESHSVGKVTTFFCFDMTSLFPTVTAIAHDRSKEFHWKFNRPVAAKMIQLQNPLLRFLKTTKGNFSGEDF